MSIEIEIDTKDYEIFIHNLNKASQEFPRQVIEDLTPMVEEELVRTVPVDTGAMRDSIRSNVFENFSVVGTHTAELPDSDGYAKAVDQGKRAVRITAKGKENGGADYLRFEIDGRTFFRKSVFVPAQDGQFFVAKTLRNVKPKIADAIRQAWNELN